MHDQVSTRHVAISSEQNTRLANAEYISALVRDEVLLVDETALLATIKKN